MKLLPAILCVGVVANAAVAKNDVQYIPSRDYVSVVSREINNARTSIRVVMYLFSLYPNSPQSQVMQLADALAAAHRRNVDVRVLLDKGDFSAKGGNPAEAGDNREAYGYLEAKGVGVAFADVNAIVHAKAIIIDSVTVIAGSANWSESGLSRNREASLLVRDTVAARAALKELGTLKEITLPSPDSAAVRIPMGFYSDSGSAGRMAKAADDRAYDVYLYILRFAALGSARQGAGRSFILNYDSIAAQLGILSMGRTGYRRQINRVLDKLQDRYALVSVKTGFNVDAEVTLANKATDTAFVSVPAGYWDYSWPLRLDFPARIMYALNLYYSSVSLSKPQWSMAAETIARLHGLTRGFVIAGTTGLRRANLVDVVYDDFGDKNDSGPRHSNIYTPLPLYDPGMLDAKFKGLEAKYGKEKTGRARACAELVYKDSDFDAMEKFILLEEKYGIAKIQQAYAIIAQKAPDNPKRSVGYFVGTVMGLK